MSTTIVVFAAMSTIAGEQMRQTPTATESQLRRELARRPGDAGLRLKLVRTFIDLGRIPDALAELQRVLASSDPEVRFQAGGIARELAERRFAELERVAPESASVRELAGRQYELRGNLAEALREYRSALAKDPSRPGVHFEIGNVLWRMRDLDTAERELHAELARTPRHGMANLRLGQLYLSRNEESRAVPVLERAVEAMPDSIEARRELGKAYRKMDRLTDARAQWESVAKMRPEDDQVHYLLGNLYRVLGQDSLAQQELARHRAILQRRAARE